MKERGSKVIEATEPTQFQFGEYVLDVAAGLVWQGDRRIELRPQTFAVLEYLVRHSDELVTKEDLLGAVWTDRVVTDDSVTHCISEIRSSLGAPGQDLLRTVPRRGYRLESGVSQESAATDSPETSRGGPVAGRVALSIAAVLVLAFLVWIVQKKEGHETTGSGASLAGSSVPGDVASAGEPGTGVPTLEEPRRSLAVLPFTYRGGDESRRYLADGLHDDVLTSLAQSSSLRVISRTSVMPFAESDLSLGEIAAELGVDHVLEGSVEVSDDSIRVIAQLIEARTDAHVWAETFDRALEPAGQFALRSEISRQIAAALEVELRLDPAAPTNVPLALEAYHRGRLHLLSRRVEPLEKAAGHFQRAVALDPGFADAWVGVADSQMLLAQAGVVSLADSWARQEMAIDRALAIDPDHPGAHAARGWFHWQRHTAGYVEEAEAGERAFRRAIELGPNDARARMGYALLLNGAYPERIEESIRLLEAAQRLDPRSTLVAVNLAGTYRFRGMFDPAERAFLEVLDWDPDNWGARRVLGRLYLDWGRLADSLALAEAAVGTDPRNVMNWERLGEVALELRDLDRARQALAELRARAPGHIETLKLEVKLLDRTGDPSAVGRRLDEALERIGPEPNLVQFATLTMLFMGDLDAAKSWLSLDAAFADEKNWPNYLRRHDGFACALGWLARQSGQEQRGVRFFEGAHDYLINTLPERRDHVDRYNPDVCHLAAGEREAALASIEQQVAHRHIASWDDWHRLPLFASIRDEPRYRAARAQREKMLETERRRAGLGGDSVNPED